MPLSDDDFLIRVAAEKHAAIGFDDDILSADRIRALDYYKGEMADVPSLPNRSKAVSSDIADAVETVLPDIIEIFTGGDDVAVFVPRGAEDEAAAAQETAYVNYVVFDSNDGFMNFYTMFKDALLQKTGALMAWWEDGRIEEEFFEGKSGIEMAIAAEQGEIANIKEADESAGGETLYDFTLRRRGPGSVRIRAIAPEDLAVSKDTVRIWDSPYCAYRSHPRAQDLLASGLAKDKVARLPDYAGGANVETERARDTAGEQNDFESGAGGELRIVEIITHFIRLDSDEDGVPELWRVVTDAEASFILLRERVNRADIYAVTPFPVTHRFFGQSIADKLLETQRIKTALTRALLDSCYFALNQRMEVASDGANVFTIPDLLRNEPGFPVRSKSGAAVRPIASGGLSFDAYSALEYFSAQAEQRTGVVRNAQGLNPDTLHDTAKGAMALMAAAQKRVRMIARIFAETGIKDLFLGVHALIRENASKSSIVRLRGQWVEIDPTAWGERHDMKIEIGLGAGGREHDSQMMMQLLNVLKEIVALQGNADGPLVKLPNVHAALKALLSKWGLKAPELYISDPAHMPPVPPAPGVDPQLEAARARLAADMQIKREEILAETALKREQMNAELQLKRERMTLEAQLRVAEAEASLRRTGAATALSDVTLGGRPG